MSPHRKHLYLAIAGLNLLSYSTFFLLPDEEFIKIAKEDSFFEVATAVLFLVTSFLFFALFFSKRFFCKFEDRQIYSTFSKRIFFFLFGIMFFIFFGEEISWGQRLVGFETPEAIKARNMQNEFNFHNLDVLHHWDEGKEFKTGIKSFLTAKRIFIYTFVLYLFLIPFLINRIEIFRRAAKWLNLPVPAIGLGVLFIFNLLIYNAFKWHYGYIKTVRVMGEIEEFNFALVLFVLPLTWIGFPNKH